MDAIKRYWSYVSGPWASYVSLVERYPTVSAVALLALAFLAIL